MRTFLFVLLLLIAFSPTVLSFDIQSEIEKELDVGKLDAVIPDSVINNEYLESEDLNYSNAQNSVSLQNVLNTLFAFLSVGIKEEIKFFALCFSALIVSAVFRTFASSIKSVGVKETVNLAISIFLCVVLYSHILNLLDMATTYITELTTFIKALLPFMTTVLCIQGGVGEAVFSNAFIIAVIAVITSFLKSVVLPLCKLIFAFICAGVLSGVSFSPITDFASSVASKTCTISLGVFSAIMYFRNSLTSAADSLALRSAKLAATNFIPIVGGNVSEAVSTILGGAKLVKSTLGVFAFAIIFYLTLVPLVRIIIKKIFIRLLSAFSLIIGCTDEGKLLNSVHGVYNIIGALMVASAVFFIIALAVFVKSGGV